MPSFGFCYPFIEVVCKNFCCVLFRKHIENSTVRNGHEHFAVFQSTRNRKSSGEHDVTFGPLCVFDSSKPLAQQYDLTTGPREARGQIHALDSLAMFPTGRLRHEEQSRTRALRQTEVRVKQLQ